MADVSLIKEKSGKRSEVNTNYVSTRVKKIEKKKVVFWKNPMNFSLIRNGVFKFLYYGIN